MRGTSFGFSLTLGLGIVGMVTGLFSSGCGQLWRPFLEPQQEASASDLGVPDLALPSSPIGDMGAPPWTIEPSGTTRNLYAVWGASTVAAQMTESDGGSVATQRFVTSVLAAGAEGAVLQRASSSAKWSGTTLNTSGGTLYGLSGHNAADAIVVGDKQFMATWNGASWTTYPTTEANAFLGVSVTVDSSTYLGVGTADTAIFLKGQTRGVLQGYTPTMVDLTSASLYGPAMWIGTGRGDVIKYEQGIFTTYGMPRGNAVRSIWARSAKDVWAVGDGGLAMHYDGVSWNSAASQFPEFKLRLHCVTGNSKGEVWIVGDYGHVLYSSGQGWVNWQHPSLVTLRSIWLDPLSGGVWIVGDGGFILHSGPATQ